MTWGIPPFWSLQSCCRKKPLQPSVWHMLWWNPRWQILGDIDSRSLDFSEKFAFLNRISWYPRARIYQYLSVFVWDEQGCIWPSFFHILAAILVADPRLPWGVTTMGHTQPWPTHWKWGVTEVQGLGKAPAGSFHNFQGIRTVGGFLQWESPIAWWFIVKNPTKMDDLRVPLF